MYKLFGRVGYLETPSQFIIEMNKMHKVETLLCNITTSCIKSGAFIHQKLTQKLGKKLIFVCKNFLHPSLER